MGNEGRLWGRARIGTYTYEEESGYQEEGKPPAAMPEGFS
jgi:hypothetical protein